MEREEGSTSGGGENSFVPSPSLQHQQQIAPEEPSTPSLAASSSSSAVIVENQQDESDLLNEHYERLRQENNLGVANMFQGNMNEAFRNFCRALDLVRQRPSQQQQQVERLRQQLRREREDERALRPNQQQHRAGISQNPQQQPQQDRREDHEATTIVPHESQNHARVNHNREEEEDDSWGWPGLQSIDEIINALRDTQSSDIRSDGIILVSIPPPQFPTGAVVVPEDEETGGTLPQQPNALSSSLLGIQPGDGADEDRDATVTRRRRRVERNITSENGWSLLPSFIVFNLGVFYSIGGLRSGNDTFLEKARIMFASSRSLLLDVILSAANNYRSNNDMTTPPTSNGISNFGVADTTTNSAGSTTIRTTNEDTPSNSSISAPPPSGTSTTTARNSTPTRIVRTCHEGRPSRRLAPTGNPMVDLLCLFVLTKLSQMHYFLSNFSESRMFLEELLDFIRSFREQRRLFIIANHNTTRTNGREEELEVQDMLEAHCERFLRELYALSWREPVFAAAA